MGVPMADPKFEVGDVVLAPVDNNKECRCKVLEYRFAAGYLLVPLEGYNQRRLIVAERDIKKLPAEVPAKVPEEKSTRSRSGLGIFR